ncbi:hypothetical protein QTP70_013631 [Hemibagrus guttatus]|uniref:Reverse transcriptase domain-containing protein n=1 Tax=Hemibagrus guttatus TaxID=175788 RepID=A0AAE0RK19_9TELE|nr:hypothetical protein QTP70_013631 [Hemibagrus guttatus]
MAGGKAPGIDGLPVEFYKFFWRELGEDLLEVLNKSCREMCLPLSSRRKKLAFSVTALTDYKIVSKRWSIIDNVSLIRDILDVSSSLAVDLGLISLDQEKAFDRVEHQYLWKPLEAFGLSPGLIAMMKVRYQEAESVLKTNRGLSAPFKVKRGISQGCSLSDDIMALVQNQSEVKILEKIVSDFSLVSSSRINWKKSEAIAVGNWSQGLPKLPVWTPRPCNLNVLAPGRGVRMDIKDSSPGLTQTLQLKKFTRLRRLVDTAGLDFKDTRAVDQEFGYGHYGTWKPLSKNGPASCQKRN